MKRDEVKRRKSEAFKCKQCKHGSFALVCMVMHFFMPFLFLCIYSIQVATSLTSLHNLPLTITTSITTTINKTTTTTVTIINATTNTTLDSATRPPPSPTLTGQPPQQQSQQQQGAWDVLRLKPQVHVCLFFFQFITITTNFYYSQSPSPSIITTPHHKSNIENTPKTHPPSQQHVQMLQEQQQQQPRGLRCDMSQGLACSLGMLFFFFFYILLTTFFL